MAWQRMIAWLIVLTGFSAAFAGDQKAKTEDGRVVILKDDGTWIYEEVAAAAAGPAGSFRKDPAATATFKGGRVPYVIHYRPKVWKESREVINPDAEMAFLHEDGDVYAMVIAERIQAPVEAVIKGAIENARQVDEDMKIVSREDRVVNGQTVTCLTMDVAAEGVPIRFHNYYYAGKAGSIQILTWTGQNLFEEYKPDMEAFLNGFEIVEK